MAGNVRKAVAEGRSDCIPIFLSEIPLLFHRKIVKPDVAFVQVSMPAHVRKCCVCSVLLPESQRQFLAWNQTKCMGVLVMCILYSDWGSSYPDWGFSYPDWGFSVFFPQLWGKYQGNKSRKDGAWPALFQTSCYLCCSVVIYVVLCIVCV